MELLIPGEFYEASVELSAIFCHRDLQVRALALVDDQYVRKDIVRDYRTLYDEDKDLGRLTLVEEVDQSGEATGRFLLADGNHRFEALKQLGREVAPCTIYRGDKLTAILLAARENGGRGLQFSLNDRKKVAEKLLLGLAKRGVTWSDREIGDWAGLSRATVSDVRAELKNRRDVDIPDEIEVHTKDGRVYIIRPPLYRRAGLARAISMTRYSMNCRTPTSTSHLPHLPVAKAARAMEDVSRVVGTSVSKVAIMCLCRLLIHLRHYPAWAGVIRK